MKTRYEGDMKKYDSVESVLLFSGKRASDPVLSICIPAYCRAKTLQETLNSIVLQQFGFSYEIIICDNSADLSEGNAVLSVAREFSDAPLRLYVNSQNIGMTGNWNRLVQLSRGKVIAFIHDDDLLARNYSGLANRVITEIQDGHLSDFGFLKVCFQGFRDGADLSELPDGNLRWKRSCLWDALVAGVGPTTTPTCGMMFNKEALHAINGFQEFYYPCADHVTGFVIEEKGYKGYITVDNYSYYRWGANESLNIRTQFQTYEKNTAIRAYFYQHNAFYMLFGKMFEKAQRYLNLKEITGYCQKVEPGMTMEDIEKNPFSVSSVSIRLLKCLRRVNHITRRMRRES